MLDKPSQKDYNKMPVSMRQLLTEGSGDLDLDRDLQKVPETIQFKINSFLLTTFIQEP